MNSNQLTKIAQQNVYSPKALKFGKTLKTKIHKTSIREHMAKKYGANAFLLPEQKKFPIVNPNTGKVSCKLLKAAKIRAAQHGYGDVATKASRLMQQHNCVSSPMQKQAALAESALVAGLGHLTQNQVLKTMMNKETVLPKIIENRLTRTPTTVGQVKKGLANTALPELGIVEDEARHSYKDIAHNMGYKEKIHTIHALKGNWSRLAQSEQGRQVLAKHLSKNFPGVGSVIHMLPHDTIKELEKVYKADKLGKNIINTTNRLVKHKELAQVSTKHKAIAGAAEGLGNVAAGFKEPVFSTINVLKRAGAADLSKFENVKNKPGKLAYKTAKGTQNYLKNFFVKNPLEGTAKDTLGDNSLAKRLDRGKRFFHVEGGNALVGGARNLDNKLMAVVKERHPLIAKQMHAKLQERANNRGIRGFLKRMKEKRLKRKA